MSAFVLGKDHIDALVTLSAQGPREAGYHTWFPPRLIGLDPRTEYDAIGGLLIAENCKSVSYRYDTETDLPGPIDEYYRLPYRHRDTPRLSAVEALKLIACYEYQSCEHPAWEVCDVKKWCDMLTAAVICCLPGYEKASWEWHRKDVVTA